MTTSFKASKLHGHVIGIVAFLFTLLLFVVDQKKDKKRTIMTSERRMTTVRVKKGAQRVLLELSKINALLLPNLKPPIGHYALNVNGMAAADGKGDNEEEQDQYQNEHEKPHSRHMPWMTTLGEPLVKLVAPSPPITNTRHLCGTKRLMYMR